MLIKVIKYWHLRKSDYIFNVLVCYFHALKKLFLRKFFGFVTKAFFFKSSIKFMIKYYISNKVTK